MHTQRDSQWWWMQYTIIHPAQCNSAATPQAPTTKPPTHTQNPTNSYPATPTEQRHSKWYCHPKTASSIKRSAILYDLMRWVYVYFLYLFVPHDSIEMVSNHVSIGTADFIIMVKRYDQIMYLSSIMLQWMFFSGMLHGYNQVVYIDNIYMRHISCLRFSAWWIDMIKACIWVQLDGNGCLFVEYCMDVIK